MPGLSAEDKPVLGGGDLAGIFSQDNEAAQELVQFLPSAEFGTTAYGAERRLDLAAHRLRHQPLPERDPAKAIAEIAYELDRLRVRRLGPDAR